MYCKTVFLRAFFVLALAIDMEVPKTIIRLDVKGFEQLFE